MNSTTTINGGTVQVAAGQRTFQTRQYTILFVRATGGNADEVARRNLAVDSLLGRLQRRVLNDAT